jgi:phospholipid transport system substrate-binding protein
MARLTVGAGLDHMSEADHKAITDAFGRLDARDLCEEFRRSSAASSSPSIRCVKMRNDDKISTSRNWCGPGRSTIPSIIGCTMVGDKWTVIDVYLNGYVSQVALRRADFSSTVASSGASGWS